MLRIIAGRASSGKSTEINKIIKKLAPGGNVILVAPEQFSFEAQKRTLSYLGTELAGKIGVYSFTSLSNEILKKYSGALKPLADSASKNVLMSRALESVKDKLTVFGRFSSGKGVIEELVTTCSEIAARESDAAALVKAAEKSGDEKLEMKTKDLDLIEKAYSDNIGKFFTDSRYTQSDAAKIIAEKKLFAGKYVFLDEFYGFTGTEYDIIEKMLIQAEDVYAALTVDDLYKTDDISDVFAYTRQSFSNLRTICAKNNIKIAEPIKLERDDSMSAVPLGFFERGIYKPNPEIFRDKTDALTVVYASSPFDECEYAAMESKRLVMEENFRYRDIAVISRTAESGKFLSSAFKKYDIPVFEDTRRPLSSDITVRYMNCALKLASGGFDTETVLSMLKTGLTESTDEDISELENYTIIWRKNGQDWNKEWTGHPDGYGARQTLETENRLERINNVRKFVSDSISHLSDEITGKDVRGCLEALYYFMKDTGADKRLASIASGMTGSALERTSSSWDEAMEIISKFATIFGSEVIEPKRFAELFSLMADSSDAGEMPSGLDEITVGQADRIRMSGKKAVFILGANEGIFPLEQGKSVILNGADRKILNENGASVFDDSVTSKQKERFYVYSSISIPKNRLYILSSSQDIKSGTLRPSEIVSMADRIVPLHKTEYTTDISPMRKIASMESAFEAAAAGVGKNDVFSLSAAEYIKNGKLSDKIKSVKRTAEKEPFHFGDDEKAKKLFGDRINISPSGMETYYKCPFMFFMSSGMKAYTLRYADFDRLQNGDIVHYILQNTSSIDEKLDDMTRDDIYKIVSDLAVKYAEEMMGGKENITRLNYFYVMAAAQTCLYILLRRKIEKKKTKFKTVDTELEISRKNGIKPFEIKLSDGSVVSISGKIDRVDEAEIDGKNFIRIIDYKTGAKTFSINSVADGLDSQMIIYLDCICENGQERYGQVLPAGLLYSPANWSASKYKLDRNAADADIQAEFAKTGRMNGLILDNEKVVDAMETGEDKYFLPSSKESRIDGKRFGYLFRYVEDKAASMGENLRHGVIPALPLEKTNVCDYCVYKSVCLTEPGDKMRPRFSSSKEETAWDVIEKDKDEDNENENSD